MKQFWKDKKILITGHTGFCGSWLSLWLNNLGADLMGFSLEAEDPRSIFYKAKVSSIVKNRYGDIRDINSFKKNISEFQPEIIFHLAAQALVRESYSDPLGTLQTNVIGTANVIESIRDVGSVKAVLVITSDKCYENNETNNPFVESDPMGGFDPYSASKGCAELVTQSYRDSYFKELGVFIASARAGNIIGGGDWSKNRLIPDLVESIKKNLKVQIRNPEAVRPWQHVLDPLCGYIKLAKQLYEGVSGSDSPWNFGPYPQEEKKVKWITENFLRMWGSELLWELNEGTNPHEAEYLRLDSSKAINNLAWSPKWDTSEALEKTVEWYQKSFSMEDMTDITLQQIRSYENLIKV